MTAGCPPEAPLRQCLHFCTSKASKLSGKLGHTSSRAVDRRGAFACLQIHIPFVLNEELGDGCTAAAASVFELLYQ